jgi:hypothetical protein
MDDDMEKKQLVILRSLLSLTDILVLNMCLFVGSYLSNKYSGQYNGAIYLHTLLPANALWVLTTSLFRVYGEYTVYKIADINKATWRSIILFACLLELYLKITTPYGFPSQFIYVFFGLITIVFFVSRFSYVFMERMMNVNYNKRTASVLAIASIGGHWIELQRLMPVFRQHDVSFISNKKDLKGNVRGSKHYNVPDANKDQKLNLIKCFFAVLIRVAVLRPRVIITTGAAPGLMGILVGRFFGAKTIWIDSIANVEKLSLSGRIALIIADRVYTQWAHLSTPKVVYSGNLL